MCIGKNLLFVHYLLYTSNSDETKLVLSNFNKYTKPLIGEIDDCPGCLSAIPLASGLWTIGNNGIEASAWKLPDNLHAWKWDVNYSVDAKQKSFKIERSSQYSHYNSKISAGVAEY